MKVMVVMPAFNAAATLERTVRDIPRDVVDEIVVVDDASADDTVEIARGLGVSVLVHRRNMGYGRNQKTCYREALRRGGDVVVMVHPDYQYDARLVPYLVSFIRDGYYDVMLGSRIRTRREVLEGGMPLYKYLGNRFLTIVENVCLGQNLSEFHTGLRAYSRRVLETIPWERNSDGFVFDTQFLVQAVAFGFRIGEFPVPVRYSAESSSIGWKESVAYGCRTLATVGAYFLHRWRIRESGLFSPKALNIEH